MKLNAANLGRLGPDIAVPTYDRTAVRQGIVHIGVGGFHRAHQALYTERLLNLGKAREWGICGVGLRPDDRAMKEALAPQDYLYTLYELGEAADAGVAVIGALQDFLLAEESPAAVLEKLAAPETRIVSLTITEGGYCTDDSTGEFNARLPQILHDLANPQDPRTVFGFLAEALARRRVAGIKPFTVMSCDNLPHNGKVARHALLSFAALRNVDLGRWIAEHVSFPNAMVDRITPMTSAEHRHQLQAEHGIEDNWPVVCEPFTQWVLEDDFCNGRPPWEEVGVQFTHDVTPYEAMKIGLLNGSHLALTYLGFLQGYRFVHETMHDDLYVRFVRAFMDEDVTPLLADVPGIDLGAYKQTLIDRFANRAICDQLARTCSDGSSKFPKFVLPTVLDLIARKKPLHRVALIVASWAHYLRGIDETGNRFSIPDPRAEWLQQSLAGPSDPVRGFLGLEDVFGRTIPASAAFVVAFEDSLQRLQRQGVRNAMDQVLSS